MTAGNGGTQWEPSHLRRLLLAAGVGEEGGRHGYRELARQSGHRLSKTTFSRLVAPIPKGERGHRWAVDDLRVVAETLQKVGERITFREIERAVLADLGYAQAVSGDDLSEVLARVESLSPADQLRLIQEVAQLLAPDGLADHSRTSASRTPREG